MSAARYAELQCTSHFSFLRGASSCEELFDEAARLGDMVDGYHIVAGGGFGAKGAIGRESFLPALIASS